MKAYCLNKISKVALSTLKAPDKTVDKIEDADSILVRSQDMHDMELPESVLAVARAGAGVNNIPLDDYAKKGVVVFNTPGANANAVKELVLCALFLGSRDIIGGNKWVIDNVNDPAIAKSAEKAKSQFAGNEIYGKTIAVLGLGKIGVLVADACANLGMKVVGYDPYLSIANAMKLEKEVEYVETVQEAVKEADFITVHIPAMDATKGMLNKEVFAKAKPGVTILNFSRDSLVNDDDLLEAMSNGVVKKYITDFANSKVVKMEKAIVLPHLGASTDEAEDNCALMAVNQLKDYLENGNITNSVNFPATNAGIKYAAARICILHTNVPGMIAKFSSLVSDAGGNIITLVNKSKGEYAYTIIDVDKSIETELLKKVEGVLKVRII